ncbi:phage replisome organizer N-terminal domain-containing protein [Enterococcus sp. DIV1758]|uniref:phage replisome organizer N-terminal domain-containing protein n=1 Tax=Enterococcus sp. DIV1758 TaxID=2774744 RepID=UPI003F211C79
MAEISWIKLSTSLPDNKKIKRIRKLPDGDRVILFWVFLLARAGESNQKGGLFLTDTLPYSDEDLAADFDFTVEFVKFAILTLEKYSMVTTYEDVIFIKNWEEYQAIDGMEKVKEQNRIRQAKYREKQKQLSLSNVTSNVTRNADVTLSNGTDKDIDKEIDKDKDKKNRSKTSCKYSDEHLRLAEKLKNNLINDFPSEMKRVKIEKWADTFRLIEKRDQQTIAAIDYVLDWLPTNSFWFGNIRSASKLRTQFEKLKFEIKSEIKRSQRQTMRVENLPEWAKEPNKQQEEKLSPEEQAEFDRQIKEYMEGK